MKLQINGFISRVLIPLMSSGIALLGAPNSLNLSEDLVRLGIASSNMVPNQPLQDSGPLLYQGVNYAIQYQVPLVVADPGTYYFSSLQNPNWHVQLEGLHNMTVDLQGANLIFSHPLQNGLYLGFNNNVTFQNFTADYQPLPFTQVSVAAVNPNTSQIQYSVRPGWQDPSSFNNVPSGTIIEVHIFRDGQRAFGTRRMAASLPIANNLITIISYDTTPTPQSISLIRPGDIAVVTTRLFSTAILADRCVSCTFRNITIYSGSNGGIDAVFSTSSTFERVYMIPKPGTDRLVSSLGINSNNPGPNSVIRLNRAIRSMDDSFGLFNWCTGAVQSQNSPQSLTVAGTGNTTLSWLEGVPNGTPVAFQAPLDGSVLASAVVVSQVAGSSSVQPYTVTYNFDRALPASVVGSFMYPTDANLRGANSVVERNLALSGGGAGIDYGGWASNSTVHGNYIHRIARSGITGYQELEQSFGEPKSTPLMNVTFSNNVVDDVNVATDRGLFFYSFGGMQMATLRSDQNGYYNPMTASPHQNISMTNNFIADPGRSAFFIGNTAVGTVTGNYLWNPNNNPDIPDMDTAYAGDAVLPIVVDPTSSGIVTSNNQIDQSSLRVFVTDTMFRELAAYPPGGTARLNAYGIGQLSAPTLTLTDADGNSAPMTIVATTSHSIDVTIPSSAALGGAFITLTSGGVKYFGTLFVDSQDNIPALNGCVYEISPASLTVSASATNAEFLVVTQPGCAYQPSAAAPFVTAGSSATGAGVVQVAFAANTGTERSATIEIAGQPLTITQAAPPLGFYPVTPCRAVDTRASQGKTGAFGPPSMAGYSGRDFPLMQSGCGLPSNAQAYSLNFTVVPPGPLDFLSAWPSNQPFPGVSTLNSPDGSTIANAAIVPADPAGKIKVTTGEATDLIIDTNGYFAPPNGSELAFYPITPCRVADTRSSQGKTGAFGPPALAAYSGRTFPVRSSSCNIPNTAAAYALNLTVVPPGPLSFLSIWPADKPFPGVSTLNSNDGSIIANAAIVPAAANGDVTVTAGNATDFIMDINGYFAAPGAPGALHFYSVPPCRVADTRPSQGFSGAFGPPGLAPYQGRSFPIQQSACGIPATANAYSLNFTVVPQAALSFLSAWPSDKPFPGVSTLNSPKGLAIANAAIVPAAANGSITVTAGNTTDLIIDINGYFAP